MQQAIQQPSQWRPGQTDVRMSYGGAGPKHQVSIDDLRELVVDNFAGGGGASTGIALALGRSVDIAINHDPQAIAMHKTNHPDTRHYCESVWDIDPREVTQGVPVGLAWFSPDCKHFSKAKGGKPVSKKIRGLAWIIVKWAVLAPFRVGMMENVEEFKTWGPIDDNGMPIKERAGETFEAFVACMTTGLAPGHPAWEEIRDTLGPDFPYERLEQGLGYNVEFRELKACDHGAPTIRIRLFGIIRRDGRPIVWPMPTHGDPKGLAVQAGKLLPWRTAAEIIDWSIPCPSIFERKRPLKEATLRRIARGIMKFVVNSGSPFIIPVTHHGSDRVASIDAPFPTVTAAHRSEHALISPILVVNTTGHPGSPPNEPLRTVTTGGHHMLIAPVIDRQFTRSTANSADEPLGTITAGGSGKSNLVTAFLAKHFGGGYTGPGNDLDEPLSTVTTVDHNALVTAFLTQYHTETPSHDARGQTLDRPIFTVDTANRYGLVTSNLVKLRGTCPDGQPVTEPMPTITAGGLHVGEVRAFLLKYYGTADGQSLGEPTHTVTTKHRLGLVTVHGEDYQIVDIGMRMLAPHELFAAQGFPNSYIIDKDLDGNRFTKTSQVARCGNAVPPDLSRVLVEANVPELRRQTGVSA